MNKVMINLAAALAIFMGPALAFAEDAAAGGDKGGLFYIAKAITISLAVIGGALGQGKLVSAALEGIARNPGAAGQIFTPMILGIAFVESLVIFALVIAFTM